MTAYGVGRLIAFTHMTALLKVAATAFVSLAAASHFLLLASETDFTPETLGNWVPVTALFVTMGLLFLGLLYLQVKYFEESLHIRKEQFDESVARSLYQACHDLELSEVKLCLERELNIDRPAPPAVVRTAKPHEAHVASREAIPANVSKGLFLDNLTALPADTVLRDSLRQRMLLGEVLGAALYAPTSRPLAERVDFPTLDANLRTALRNNGISIDYHFYVTTSDGREVYRCVDFVADGMDYQYSHILFPNGPSAQKGVLYIHFPDLHKYIFASVRFFITALVFTLILLIVFIFTIYSYCNLCSLFSAESHNTKNSFCIHFFPFCLNVNIGLKSCRFLY